ncbi:MAG: serine/threonine protein kinase [Oscillospiraceae bacterium]|nr:serine/threonine protein kinase [Oscillospiraceae bacterium]
MLRIGSYVDGKYKILNEISRGGMGVVYMAVNEKVNKTWAIKVACRSGVHDNNMAIQNLAADRRTLIGLSHPHLPSIVDIYETENSMMLVMDYIEGQPLSQSLKESGALPQEDVIRWAMQLCDVLGYLHSHRIIYRDMKPSNVIRRPDGNIVLIDFGATRRFKEQGLADTQCLGTIGYAAPEQFGGLGQTDARTDIYCLGATMHHLLTGIDPCREATFRKAPIRQANPALSGGLERIVEKCLRDDKSQRYQSCAELMYDLAHYEEMDDIYRKRQKRRLMSFAAPTLMAILFTFASLFGHASAENRKNADYNLKLAAAEDARLSQEERLALYLDAIRFNQTDDAAYLYLIRLFLTGDQAARCFSREEASIVTQLKAGLDIQDSNGHTVTIYPLESLKAKNPEGYERVCFEIGMAYWYDYEVEADRYATAIEWFYEAANSYPISATYADIGNCHLDINRFEGQRRTETMYRAYEQLWDKLPLLAGEAEKLEDNDAKLLAWRVIVENISCKAAYFLVHVSLNDVLVLLDDIAAEANLLKSGTKFQDFRDAVDDLQRDIDEAAARVRSASASREGKP